MLYILYSYCIWIKRNFIPSQIPYWSTDYGVCGRSSTQCTDETVSYRTFLV